MAEPLWIAKTGLDAQKNRLSTISNNLANVNTTGFKRSRTVFEDLVYQNVRQPGGKNSEETVLPSGLQIGTGVKTVATQKLHQQGSLLQTANPFDMAIQGRGFFQILQPNGNIAYTRNGEFQLSPDGQLVNANGYRLQPDFNIPQNATGVTIGIDGTVSVSQPGNPNPAQIGTIQIADFVNPGGLQALGGNLLAETAASGPAIIGAPDTLSFGSLMQGSLEGSNVNVVEELVNMIETQRAYEMNSKAISTADQMLQYVNNNL